MRVVSDDVWAALTIWQEARGEPFEGKVAVGRVIRNRMARRWSRDGNVVDTVLAPFQFSGWNTGDPNRRACAVLDDADPIYADCLAAWRQSLSDDAGVDDAAFYYNPAGVKNAPEWAVPDKRVAVVGAHHFYRF